MTPPSPAETFARTLAALPVAERRDHFASAVIEGGGIYHAPRNRPPGRSMVAISLYGIQATGWLEDQAIESWMRIATGDGARHEP